jgi:hypothetical protein
MLLAVIMVVSLVPVVTPHVHAHDGVVLSGGEVEGFAGETVEVEVLLSSNPGMAYLEVKLSYDTENLELKKAVLGDLDGDVWDFYTNGKLSGNPRMTWSTQSGYNAADTGLAATLTFLIKGSAAPGVYSFSFEYIDACDEDFNTLETTLIDGSITVKCKHPTTENHPEQAPNCRDVGYTAGVFCTVCSSYIDGHEEIPTTDDHSYGNYIEISDTQHERVCGICQKHEVTAHKWDDGKETLPPSHVMEGEMTYTCTLCYATKTEKITSSPGDVNGDGQVNASDVAILRRYLAGWKGYADKVDLKAANVNGDDRISATDVAILRRYLAGWQGVELK